LASGSGRVVVRDLAARVDRERRATERAAVVVKRDAAAVLGRVAGNGCSGDRERAPAVDATPTAVVAGVRVADHVAAQDKWNRRWVPDRATWGRAAGPVGDVDSLNRVGVAGAPAG